MNIKQHYCIVTQEEAYEARELLVMAGEEIWEDELGFEISHYDFADSDEYISYNSPAGNWGVFEKPKERGFSELTYPQFKEMLNEKIKENNSLGQAL